MKNLHIINYDSKFTQQILKSLKKYAIDDENYYVVLGHYTKDFIYDKKNTIVINKNTQILKLLYLILKSKFIIFNNMGGVNKLLLAFFATTLKKRTCWIIWGGDLYNRNKGIPKYLNFINYFVLKNIDFLAVQINRDYSEAIRRYPYMNAKKLDFWFPFPYNIEQINENLVKKKTTKTIKVVIGNSADPSNNHLQILDYISKFKNENIEIILPLSYGKTDSYIDKVLKKYKDVFGTKFISLLEMMPFNDYMQLLNSVDIGIFAHERQQAGHNIMLMLYFEKKVYINKKNGYYDASNNEFDTTSFNIESLNKETFEQFQNFNSKVTNKKNMSYILSKTYLEKRITNFYNGLH